MTDHERIDKLDERLQDTEKVVFNGLRDMVVKMDKWLDEIAPKLLTREEHERIDDDKAAKAVEVNRQIGKKKDRRLVVLGIAIPTITVITLKILELL